MSGWGKGLKKAVYPAYSVGKYRNIHRWSGPLLISLFVIIPWLSWGGNPLFRIDVKKPRVDFFGLVLGSNDTYLLFVAAIVSALTLGLMTALAGRLWCGFLCPQTVFLETLIRPIERWIEGERGARIRLDKSKWNLSKAGKKGVKWFVFAVISWSLTAVFLSYFVSPWDMLTGKASATIYWTLLILGAVLAFDLFWFREQFCNHLCPYPRIQGVLTDSHSLVISYDEPRGEPRLGLIKGDKEGRAKLFERGGCVDCNRCVQVCPQGIDIRDGFQYECIACGHCIDACTVVMGKYGKATLIDYTTQAASAGEEKPKWRPRPILYAVMIVLILGWGIGTFVTKGRVNAAFNRVRGAETAWANDGRELNHFEAQLWNHSAEPLEFSLAISDWPEAEFTLAGGDVTLQSGEHRLVRLFVMAPPEGVHARTHRFNFEIQAGRHTLTREAIFMRPTSPQPARGGASGAAPAVDSPAGDAPAGDSPAGDDSAAEAVESEEARLIQPAEGLDFETTQSEAEAALAESHQPQSEP